MLEAQTAPEGSVHVRPVGHSACARRSEAKCVWSRIGQMARRSTPERSRARVSLIPVSGVGGVVDEDETGGKAENSETPKNGMVRGWDDLRETHRIAQAS